MSELAHPEPDPWTYPLADRFRVGAETLVYASRTYEPVPIGRQPSEQLCAGDVLRRTCLFAAREGLGDTACAAVCQMSGRLNNKTECSDRNLVTVLSTIGIQAEDTLMVGVTADGIGFTDQLAGNADVTINSKGVRELRGYNAFFTRTSENIALGARLADCGFVVLEFEDGAGQNVQGFVHLTRPNMQGQTALAFEVNGQPAGVFEYFLHEALEHYGADIATVKARLVAGISGQHFRHRFSDEDGNRPGEMFVGWFEQGMLKNLSNSDWRPGDPINPNDEWEPQYRDMLRWQIGRSGLLSEQVVEQGMLDPGQLELGHASNHAAEQGQRPRDSRDAYIVTSRLYLATHSLWNVLAASLDAGVGDSHAYEPPQNLLAFGQ